MKSVNTRCFSKQKTLDAGKELHKYYTERPNLFSYTFNAELHRMEYTVKEYNKYYTNVDEIRSRFEKREDLIIFRAANQSLLADAIQCLSTSYDDGDAVIRSEYLATAVADKCQFYVDVIEKSVTCHCNLVLSLPLGNKRLEMSTLELEIYFCLNDNDAELQMKLINLLPKQVRDEDLLSVASVLAEQHEIMNDIGSATSPSNTTNPDISIRDSYVSAMIPNKMGMSSTLRQMETVVNVKEKLSFFSKFNELLPSADLLAAVEQEEGVEGESTIQQPQDHSHAFKLYRDDNNPTVTSNDLDYEHHNIFIPDSERPKPILEGMVRNLTTKLSSSTANANEIGRSSPIRLYNRVEVNPMTTIPRSKPPSPPPRNNAIQQSNAISSFRNVSPPPPNKIIPSSYSIEEGWSSDDDDIDLDLDFPTASSTTANQVNIMNNMNKLLLKDLVSRKKVLSFQQENSYSIRNDFDSIIPTRKRWIRTGYCFQ